MLEWVKQGHDYGLAMNRAGRGFSHGVPNHPQLTADDALRYCIHAKNRYLSTTFPSGIMYSSDRQVGTEGGQVLPGLYEYRSSTGDNRLPGPGYSDSKCTLRTNQGVGDTDLRPDLPYGEPFTFRFYEYHGIVSFFFCGGALYRIGD